MMYTTTEKIARANVQEIANTEVEAEMRRLIEQYGDATYHGIVIDKAYPLDRQVRHCFFVPLPSGEWERRWFVVSSRQPETSAPEPDDWAVKVSNAAGAGLFDD
jgi:hypothetical protein